MVSMQSCGKMYHVCAHEVESFLLSQLCVKPALVRYLGLLGKLDVEPLFCQLCDRPDWRMYVANVEGDDDW